MEVSSHFKTLHDIMEIPHSGSAPPCSSPDLLLTNLATQLAFQHLARPSLLFWIHSNIFLVYIFILLQFILIAL